MNRRDIDNFLESLLTDDVSDNVKNMIMSLDNDGKKAIANYYDVESSFHNHADILKNVYRFGLDTSNHDKIYHYTTVESLEKILESGYFLIKASDYMNDPDEFRWASRLGKNHLEELGAGKEEIAEFDRMIESQPFKDSYIWSFTKNNDSLTLFNVYGKGMGVSIEFDLSEVMHELAMQNSNGKKSLENFGYGDAYTFPLRVEYNEQIQKAYVNPVVEEWLSAYRAYKKDPFDMKEILLHCSKNMFLFNMIFKNPSLNHEEELRFIVLKIGDQNRIPDTVISGVPYTKFNINHDLLKKVKLQTNNSYSTDGVRALLDQNGYHRVIIQNSKLPY
ncbi:DUF2971 domain-containing protein [Ligilactobacillus agilis]|uniref:DUF2971 domain-containing protein n=1 Tax=Ligilactobacillus agilis TaxID=1601 RepID=UPI0022E0ED90|nr:DUF2971 domain-containing protein [Ligilactobacillus agilis]